MRMRNLDCNLKRYMEIADEGGLVPKPLTTRREGTSKKLFEKVAALLYVMPAHHLMYGNMCT